MPMAHPATELAIVLITDASNTHTSAVPYNNRYEASVPGKSIKKFLSIQALESLVPGRWLHQIYFSYLAR